MLVRILVDGLLLYLMIGSLVWFLLATVGAVDNAFLDRPRGRVRVQTIIAALVLWPRLVWLNLRGRDGAAKRHLVAKRLARNLWGRP